jgi:molybdopterin/thiamine biosynthesis adenylyltransferase
MSTVTVAFAEQHWDELTATLDDPCETAAVLLAGVADDGDRLLLTVNSICWVPDSAYEERDQHQLRIASHGWMHALKAAASRKLLPIFIHTHPHTDPTPSDRDDVVDEALRHVFKTRANSVRYASLILGTLDNRPTLSGRVYEDDQPVLAVERVRTVGRQVRVTPAFGAHEQSRSLELDAYDRQIRAFGKAGQRILRDLRVGVVGCGGTGSAVSEQLARLGVGQLVLIDHDVVTETNVTRIYGSTLSDVERPKVDVLHDHLTAIGLGTDVEPHHANVTRQPTMELLRTCDVIFGCTDSHSSRSVLSRLAYWYLIPVIDMAVVIKSNDEEIVGIYGRVTIATPGEPCLLCRGEIDPQRAAEERYSDGERTRLAEEGYAEGLDEPDPAVIAYTTMTASYAVADLLQRLFGFVEARLSSKLLLQISDRAIGRPSGTIRDGCYCATSQKWGLADREPPLGITWAP